MPSKLFPQTLFYDAKERLSDDLVSCTLGQHLPATDRLNSYRSTTSHNLVIIALEAQRFFASGSNTIRGKVPYPPIMSARQIWEIPKFLSSVVNSFIFVPFFPNLIVILLITFHYFLIYSHYCINSLSLSYFLLCYPFVHRLFPAPRGMPGSVNCH